MNESTGKVFINNIKLNALIDSGSTNSFIHPRVVNNLSLSICPDESQVSMASSAFSRKVRGCVYVELMINERIYKQRFSVLEELCVDIILGLDFQSKHKGVILNYGGEEPPLEVCGLSSLNVPTPSLFENLSKDCKPIAVKSRKYNNVDQKFIRTEIGRLLKEDIIELSKYNRTVQI